ncbi:MAG: tryptophan 2-C-methyltransferase [Polyangiaceae bacterium]|nr:tryptophan 2-C-methyltransferase [Polyangiaceae bacterium]
MQRTNVDRRANAKGLVTLINPNFVKPGVTPYALDILCSHLEIEGFNVDVLDLTWTPDEWPSLIARYFADHRPMLVGVTLRNAGSVQPQEQRVFLPDHRSVIDEIRKATPAPIVLGGAGFSSMPYAAMEYFNVPYGVKGPGEILLCALANVLASGESPEAIAGLLLYDGKTVRPAAGGGHPVAGATLGRHVEARYMRRSGVPLRVDNRVYYDRGGLGNVLTKNGCPFLCNHCIEPDAKGATVAVRTVPAVVDELESLVSQGVFDIHTTDSEFNLKIGRSKALLREIIARRNAGSALRDLRLWIYAHPVPFDEELADLLAEAGCKGASLSAEHFCREHLAVWDRSLGTVGLAYEADDVRRVTRLLSERSIQCTAELLIGLPGETTDTLRRAVDESLLLPTTVVGFTLGLQVFPHAPLGVRMAAESAGHKVVRGLQSNTAQGPILLKPLDRCASLTEYERQFWFDEKGRVRPVFYFSPDLPEDPETIARPDGRWVRTIQWIQERVPASEHYRVALPTVAGDGKDDNNYADNPFLQRAVALGYKGAYYSWWRRREEVMSSSAFQESP